MPFIRFEMLHYLQLLALAMNLPNASLGPRLT